ncbi:MAG: hypothetical protein QM679_10105 [Patulibacter sp.]
MSGRTTYWAHDSAWHRRDRQVQLGVQFGADGPHVLAVLHSLAKEQGVFASERGGVRAGFASLGHEAFVAPDRVREIVEYAGKIGALDDLEVDADSGQFTARVSGWAADQDRANASRRQREKRTRDAAEQAVTERDMSRPVTACHAESPKNRIEESSSGGGGGERADASARPGASAPAGLPLIDASALVDLTDLATNALVAAGFDRGACDLDRPSIRQAVIEADPAPATDWTAVAEMIRRGIADGTIHAKRPSGALLFVVRGGRGLPLIGANPARAGGRRSGRTAAEDAALAAKYGSIGTVA